jgi:hypothetical protein
MPKVYIDFCLGNKVGVRVIRITWGGGRLHLSATLGQEEGGDSLLTVSIWRWQRVPCQCPWILMAACRVHRERQWPPKAQKEEGQWLSGTALHGPARWSVNQY